MLVQNNVLQEPYSPKLVTRQDILCRPVLLLDRFMLTNDYTGPVNDCCTSVVVRMLLSRYHEKTDDIGLIYIELFHFHSAVVAAQLLFV